MENLKIEICTASVQSALTAQQAGAHRIELCSALELGGITPSLATIQHAKELLHIEVFVLIRPRPGDFFYSPLEFETIKRDVLLCKAHQVDGVVIGMLDQNSDVNLHQLSALVALAHPMKVTFHRAFDRTPKPLEALEKIIDAGVHRILTSGQKPSAWEGKDLLKQLVEKAADRIIILPGAGINANNIVELAAYTKANEFHFSAKSLIKSPLAFKNEVSDNDYFETSEEKVKAALDQFIK